MSTLTKSPLRVAREALAIACQRLRLYAHKFSPKKFTQPQLFACLVLKTFLKTDYRGLVAHLADHSDLRAVLGLEFVPLLDDTLANVRIGSALADAGYDSEPNHRYARESCGVRSFIPASAGRPTAKLPTGHYRRQMKQRLNKNYGSYGQRAQAETGF